MWCYTVKVNVLTFIVDTHINKQNFYSNTT